MAASVVITSGPGAGEEGRAAGPVEPGALRSSISHSVHRNAAPPRPGGHGPGMMPMRYLIVLVRDRTRRSRARQGAGRGVGVDSEPPDASGSWTACEPAAVRGRAIALRRGGGGATA